MLCDNCGEDVGDAEICPNCGLPQHTNKEENINDTIIENYNKPTEETEIEPINREPVEKTKTPNNATTKNNNTDIFCQNCGKKIISRTATFCPQCGVNLETPQLKTNNINNTKFCQNCGSEIDAKAVICPQCGVGTGSSNSNKSTALAFILNFFLGSLMPGIGQIYLGLTKKGIILIAAYWISIVLIPFTLGLSIVLAIIIWLYALIDAIISGEAINKGEYVEDSLFGFSF